MNTFISFEDACRLDSNWDNFNVANHPLFIAANQHPDCRIAIDSNTQPVGLSIIVTDDSLANDIAGFLIYPHQNRTSVYLARKGKTEDTIEDGISVCELHGELTLNDIITAAKDSIRKCPICGKETAYKDQRRFSFAGRCCQNCLPAMRKKYEYDGWYN